VQQLFCISRALHAHAHVQHVHVHVHAHVHVHVHACISRALHVHAAHMCSEAEAEGERGWFIIRSLVPFSNKKRVRVTVSGRASLGCVLRGFTLLVLRLYCTV
jgi:hypothetical protein